MINFFFILGAAFLFLAESIIQSYGLIHPIMITRFYLATLFLPFNLITSVIGMLLSLFLSINVLLSKDVAFVLGLSFIFFLDNLLYQLNPDICPIRILRIKFSIFLKKLLKKDEAFIAVLILILIIFKAI